MKVLHMTVGLLIAIMIGVFLLAGCGSKGEAQQTGGEADSAAVGDSSATSDSLAAEGDTTDAELDRIPVEVADVYAGDIASYLLLSSTIETEKIIDVYPLVGGIIEKIFVEEGAWVEADQPLLHLVDDEIVLNEQQAEVNYQQQAANYARLEKMHNQQLISDEEFESARFAFRQAEISLNKTRLTRERTTIRSPIAGVVAERWVYEGNLVNTASKVFVITDPTEKICRVWVPERDLPSMQVGQKAFVASNIALQERFPGWIKRISPVVDPATGTCKVTVGIRDKENRLRNGMFVRTEIVIDTHQDAVLVPKAALIYENDLEWVYVVEDTMAVRKRVQIGFSDGDRFEAINGLAVGEQVVVVGQNTLKDSVGVRVVSLDSTLAVAFDEQK